MLNSMATSRSVEQFITLCTVTAPGRAISLPEFRRRCVAWAIEHGYTAPSGRLITKVMRAKGHPPIGERYEWYYTGLRWYEPGDKKPNTKG